MRSDKVTPGQVRSRRHLDGLGRLEDAGEGGRGGGRDRLILQELESPDDASQERDREGKRPFRLSRARLSFRALASPPFSRLFIIRANKVSQQAAGLERREGW